MTPAQEIGEDAMSPSGSSGRCRIRSQCHDRYRLKDRLTKLRIDLVERADVNPHSFGIEFFQQCEDRYVYIIRSWWVVCMCMLCLCLSLSPVEFYF